MKAKYTLRSFLAIFGSALIFASQAQAAVYYWDTNGTNAGLGDTAGTWGTDAFRGAYPVVAVLDGTAATAASTTTNADQLYFGTNNLALGSTASAVGIAGTNVTINAIVFGTGQGSQGVNLSGGGGTITLGGTAPTLTANNTGTNTIGAVLAGTAGITKAGAGTVVLTGANSFAGGLTIAGGGALQVGDGTNGSLTSQALNFNNGGGIFNVQRAAGSTQNMGALTFSAGNAAVISTAAGATSSQTLTFASLDARSAGATGNFSLATNTTAADNKITLTDTTNAPLSDTGSNNRGIFFGGIEFARYDTVNGYFRAVNYGTDSNAAAIVGAGVTLGIDDFTKDVKISGNITAQTTAAVNTIHLDGNSLTMQNADQVLDVDGILSNGGTVTGGALQATTGGGEIVFNVTGGNLSVASVIEDGRLTKTGVGTLTLSGGNNYTGATAINAGTLAVSGGNAIADTGAVVMANAPGATLLLNNSETIGSLAGGGFSGGNVDIGSNALTIASANNQTFGGRFIGTGSLTINSGTLTLTNKNTFAGTINLNTGGTLALSYGYDGTANPAPLSSGGTINMADGSAFNLVHPVPAAQLAAGIGATSMITGALNGVLSNGMSISNPIVITSGTAAIQTSGIVGANDWKWNFSGGVTGGTSGSQTLAINQGGATPPAHGDRQDFLFSAPIADGSGGPLGVSVNFGAASGNNQVVNVNLAAHNNFSGPIVVTNTRGLIFNYAGPTNNATSGGFFAIGGEIYRSFSFGGRNALVGTGYLGTGGNFSNTIYLATGTALCYVSSANQTLGGVISGGGNLIMERSGGEASVGTLTLSNANTYTGLTIVNNGILNLTNPLAIHNSAVDAVQSSTGSSTTGLKTDQTSLTLGGLTGTASPKSLANLFTTSSGGYSGVTALTLNPQAGTTFTYSGVIGDGALGMTLTKTGPGTQILTGNQTYTGTTTVTGGTLVFSGTSTSSGFVANGGTVQFARPASLPGSGSFTFNAGGILGISLGGANEWTLADLGSLLGGTITYTGNPSLGLDTTNAPATIEYSGAIADIGSPLTIAKLGANTLLLSGTNTYSGGTIVNGGTLQFAKTVSMPASGSVTVNTGTTLAVNLGGTGEWTTGTSGNGSIGGLLAGLGGQSGGSVSYNGNVTLGFDTTKAPGTETYTGAIADVGTALSITKLGAGTLALAGAGTYTGTTTVNRGTLLLDMNGGGLLSASSPLRLSGGNFQVRGSASDTSAQTLGSLTISPNRGGTITIDPNGGTSTTLTLGNAWSRGVGSTLLIDCSSPNAGTGQVVTAGATTGIILSNGLYGSVIVRDNTGVIGFATRAAGTNQPITRFDDTTGTTLANNSNAAATNFTTVNTVYSAGTLEWSNGITNRSVNSLTIDTTNNGGTINMGAAANILTLTSGGILFRGPNNATLTGGRVGAANTEVIVHQTGSGTLTINSLLPSGTGALTKNGSGTLIVENASNNYTGTTTVNEGTLMLRPNSNNGSATTFVNFGATLELNSSNAAVDNWRLNSILTGDGTINKTGTGWVQTNTNAHTFSGTVNILEGAFGASFLNSSWTGVTADFNVSSGALLDARGQAITIGSLNGTGTVGNTWNVAATVNVGAGNKSGTFSGTIVGNGTSGTNNLANPNGAALSLVKIGIGTQTLSGANTYTGATTINAGTLRAGAAAGGQAFGSNSVVTLANVAGATLDLNDFNQTIGSLAGGGAAGGSVNLGTATLTTGGRNATTNYAGVIGGTGGLTKTGTGVQYLSGSNTFSGPTSVNAGYLVLQNNSALGGSTATVASGATLQLENNINLAGNAVTISGTGVGGTRGALASWSGDNTWGGSVTLAADSSFFVASGNFTISGAIGGGYAVTKTGNGALILSGANDYTGGTTAGAGTLALGASNVLPDTTNVTLGGATLAASSFTDTVGTLEVTGTATISLDSGGAMVFADSSAVAWTGTLNITGTFVPGASIRFGTTSGGLTSAQLAGVTVNGSGAGTYTLDANGFLIAPVSSPFETWAGPGVAFDGDANNDGVKNGLAWIFGAPDKDANALGLLPTVDNSDPAYLIFNFRRKDDANTDPATSIVAQYSTNLSNWADALDNDTTIIVTEFDEFYGAGVDKVEVKLSRSLAVGGKLFVRLSAAQN